MAQPKHILKNQRARGLGWLTTLVLAWVTCEEIGFGAKAENQPRPALSVQQNQLLTDLQRRAFEYFWYEAHPVTGLIKDRAGNNYGDAYRVASIASTGFGLGGLVVGVERGWVTRERAEERVVKTLRFVRDKLEEHHGWHYHFVDWETGARVWNCELSSIDTGLLLAGALLAGQYFGGEAQALADELYRRADFQWMLTDGGAKPKSRLLGHGWKPETGFLRSRWDHYSEHLFLTLMGIGSPTMPIPGECWSAWDRQPGEYKGHKTLRCGPLFTYQYAQTFIPFQGRRDKEGYDYFEIAVAATMANRQFCIDESEKFRGYGSNFWGLSACDMPVKGYTAYAAPPGTPRHDGTIAPWSTVAAVAFTPELAAEAVWAMRTRFGEKLWGRYGFGISYNVDLEEEWFAPDVIGIDLGCALLSIENYRTGLVWREFSRMDWLQEALERAGFSTRKQP